MQFIKKIINKPAIRQGFVVLSDQGFLSVATFLAGIMVARGTSKEEYGLYVLVWSVAMIFQSFHHALINLPMSVRLPKFSSDEKNSYIGSSLVITFVLVALIIGLTFIVNYSGSFLSSNNDSFYKVMPFLSIIIAPVIFRTYLRNTLLAMLKVNQSMMASILSSILQISIFSYYYVLGELTLILAFKIVAIVYLVATIFMVYYFRAIVNVQLSRIMTDLKENWKLSKWLVLNAFGFMGSSQAYPWLILLLIDTSAVAVYGACLATASLLSPLLNGASAFILPKMSHGIKDGNVKTLKRMLKQSVFVLGVLYGAWLLIGWFFGEDIINLFYGSEYKEYSWLFVLLLIKVCMESVASPISNALQAIHKPSVITVSLMISTMVAVALGMYAINKYGLIGVGFAAILSVLSATLWKWIGFCKSYAN